MSQRSSTDLPRVHNSKTRAYSPNRRHPLLPTHFPNRVRSHSDQVSARSLEPPPGAPRRSHITGSHNRPVLKIFFRLASTTCGAGIGIVTLSFPSRDRNVVARARGSARSRLQKSEQRGGPDAGAPCAVGQTRAQVMRSNPIEPAPGEQYERRQIKWGFENLAEMQRSQPRRKQHFGIRAALFVTVGLAMMFVPWDLNNWASQGGDRLLWCRKCPRCCPAQLSSRDHFPRFSHHQAPAGGRARASAR